MKSPLKSQPLVREGWATAGAYADSQETADYIGMTLSTVQRWARSGELPAVKLGGPHGSLRFRKLDVERWASKQPRASA